jgi:hypothetical protein
MHLLIKYNIVHTKIGTINLPTLFLIKTLGSSLVSNISAPDIIKNSGTHGPVKKDKAERNSPEFAAASPGLGECSITTMMHAMTRKMS